MVAAEAIRRLVQQTAPQQAVLDACRQLPDWQEVEGQAVLLQAIALDPDSAAVDAAYRQRLLKGLVTALQKLDVELHEELLETYLAGMSGGEPSRWSVQTYEVEPGQRLRLRVHHGIGGGIETGGVVWPAALVLCSWLMRQPTSTFDGLDVLELGAGTGLCGLALAQCRRIGRCTLTDVVPATLDNLQLNVAALPASAAPCRVAALDWCEPEAFAASKGGGGSQLLLGADLVYEPTLAAPLASTLAALLAREEAPGGAPPRALVASVRRTDTWDRFVRELAARGLAHADRTAEAHAAMRAPDCSFWCAAEEVERVHLLEIRLGGT